MGSRQYIVPTKRMTFMEESSYRLTALATGIYYAFRTNIAMWDKAEIPDLSIPGIKVFIQAGGWPASLDVRRWRNIDDAGCALAAARPVQGAQH